MNEETTESNSNICQLELIKFFDFENGEQLYEFDPMFNADPSKEAIKYLHMKKDNDGDYARLPNIHAFYGSGEKKSILFAL